MIDRLLDRNKTSLDASLWRNGGDGLPQQTVTLSDFYRLVLVTARIFLRQLIILEEETGCLHAEIEMNGDHLAEY
jgi:hypothetical protein